MMRKNIDKVVLVLILILSSLIFSNTPGTGDVVDWLRLARNADQYGIVEGYNATSHEYAHPPGMALFSFISTKIAASLGASALMGIKLSMYFFLLSTMAIIYLVTKNYFICILSYFILMINSLGLLYLDIYFAPFLILSFFFLKKNNMLLTALFYGLASMIKMQVILLMPFYLLHTATIQVPGQYKQIDYKKAALQFVLPYAMIFFAVFIIYGMPFLTSFKAAYNEDMLSGQATNVGWILSYFIHFFYPERFGSLESSDFAIRMIRGDNFLFQALKYTFIITYTIVFLAYFKQKDKSFDKFLVYTVAAFLSYFIFNKGVHENHLHIAVLLLIVLYGENKKYFTDTLIWGLLFNINMILFYSYDGSGLRDPKTLISYRIIKNIDVSLLFSFLCVAAYFHFVFKYIIKKNELRQEDEILPESS